MRTRAELEENQMKRYQWEQDQMQHMKVGEQAYTKINITYMPTASSLLLICHIFYNVHTVHLYKSINVNMYVYL